MITPGTITSGSALAPKEYNFLASVAFTASGAGFAYVDISTGTFAVTTWDTPHWQQALRREYERVQPREVLVGSPYPLPSTFLRRQQTRHCRQWEAAFSS